MKIEKTYWCGTADEEAAARQALCAERRAQWGDDDCDVAERDGSCLECSMDLASKLPCAGPDCEKPHCPNARDGDEA